MFVYVLQPWLDDVRSILSDVTNAVSAIYAILTAAFLVAGLSYVLLPGPTLDAVFGPNITKWPVDVLMWQMIGVTLATVMVSFTTTLKVAWTS